MRNRLPTVLSATALVVAVFGVTPLGQATTNVVQTHFARNANFLRGKAPSVAAKPNTVVLRNGNGQIVGLPAARGAQGATGATGPQGPQGPAGPSGSTGPRGETGPPGSFPAPEAPIAAPFGAGWTNWGGAFETAAYWKDALGVHLRGLVTKSGGTPAIGDVILTLPEGYRPAKVVAFVVQTGETNGVGRVDLQPDGRLLWISGQTGGTDYTSLSSIYFRPG